MSPRRVVQKTATPKLPTIKDYFGKMAEEQAQAIRRLKQGAAGKRSGPAEEPPAEDVAIDPWVMHPVRKTRLSAAKRGNGSARSASAMAPKKAVKKAAKKTPKKAAKKAQR